MRDRDSTDIVLSILNNIAMNNELSITNIMYKSVLNTVQVNKYTELMMRKQLLKVRLDERHIKMYSLTQKGIKVRTLLKELNAIIGLKYPTDNFTFYTTEVFDY